MNLNTVLFPTDFSKCANDALGYTLKIFEVIPATKLTILHSIIYNDSSFISSDEKEKENTRRYNEAKERIDEVCKYVKRKKPDISVRQILDSCSPVQSIDMIAEQENVDLIIMGTKGASGIREIIIGSYASKVIKCSPCPVIIVPENFKFSPVKKIVCTTEFHASESEAVIFMLSFAALLNASITFLNIDDDSKSQNKKYNQFREQINESNLQIDFQFVHSDDIVKSIENYVSDNPPELLAALGKRRDFWDRIFGKKVPENLSFHTKIPLLSFPFQKC
jgi:nucleotide-binding universal stress UspA family protein